MPRKHVMSLVGALTCLALTGCAAASDDDATPTQASMTSETSQTSSSSTSGSLNNRMAALIEASDCENAERDGGSIGELISALQGEVSLDALPAGQQVTAANAPLESLVKSCGGWYAGFVLQQMHLSDAAADTLSSHIAEANAVFLASGSPRIPQANDAYTTGKTVTSTLAGELGVSPGLHFRTSDSVVGCAVTSASTENYESAVRCDLSEWDFTVAPSDTPSMAPGSDYGEPGGSFMVEASGPAFVALGTDTVRIPSDVEQALSGTGPVEYDQFRCQTTAPGTEVRCVNVVNGHGMTLSKAAYTLF